MNPTCTSSTEFFLSGGSIHGENPPICGELASSGWAGFPIAGIALLILFAGIALVIAGARRNHWGWRIRCWWRDGDWLIILALISTLVIWFFLILMILSLVLPILFSGMMS